MRTDTIAAVCSGPGAVGVLRISGSQAKQIAERVFSGTLTTPRMMVYGAFWDHTQAVIDCGLGVWFEAPHSYTGEDVVEFHCHGSAVAMATVLESCFAAGARAAKPGEFTRRAFLAGKMDLTQAEAVVDLIEAETVSAAKSAAAQLAGEIGRGIQGLRSELLDVAATFSAYVDYPDEEIEELGLPETAAQLNAVAEKLFALAASYARGRILKDGVKTALLGRPNAGKSSLLNALVGYDRSIVTETAGTTRDTVEESALLGEVRLRLVDTAGVRETADAIEREGVVRSISAAEQADLLLCVFDGSRPWSEEDAQVLAAAHGKCAIAVVNKSDLAQELDCSNLAEFGENIVCISTKTRDGFDALREMVSRILAVKTMPCDGSLITNARHAAAVKDAAERVSHAAHALGDGLTPDVAVGEVEVAIALLGEVTGETANDAVLTRIFERFCVGK
ncbi:MAG: tRNA uridine-5-carboxymethylaminomethyl(34) synthesis GTPase MnmE [Oscillospiraceae bacterium]|nr:tRNA uridine-5-carboxymethylaminomethyl(34) synthesis GTPase MnmE [Oscillospiraceae bacterium]